MIKGDLNVSLNLKPADVKHTQHARTGDVIVVKDHIFYVVNRSLAQSATFIHVTEQPMPLVFGFAMNQENLPEIVFFATPEGKNGYG